MKRKSAWENLKNRFGVGVKSYGMAKESQQWVRRQLVELSRLGGNPIVMQMGN